MLIIALVLAVIGLAALVFAVVSSNALMAWVCIGACALGVVLLIVDALQERKRRAASASVAEPADAAPRDAEDATGSAPTAAAEIGTHENFDADYPPDEVDEVDEDADMDEISAADHRGADENTR